MKRILLPILAIISMSSSCFSQKGNNQIGVGFELCIPTGEPGKQVNAGPGLTAKIMFGVGTAGQITFTSSYDHMKAPSEISDVIGADKIFLNLVPILAGYRHHFHNVYVEPQLGAGIHMGVIRGGDFDGQNASKTVFQWAVSSGYCIKDWDLGFRFQNGNKDGGAYSFFNIHVSYNFSLSGTKN